MISLQVIPSCLSRQGGLRRVRDGGTRTMALGLFRSTSKEALKSGGDGGQLLTERRLFRRSSKENKTNIRLFDLVENR